MATLTIGEFSRATHLTSKSLRHYHALGLLVPAEVDEATGYRRYDPEQIGTALVVRRLRDVGMPLEEIGTIVAAADPVEREREIRGHLLRLSRDLDRTRQSIEEVERLLSPPSFAAGIELRATPAVRAAVIIDVIETSTGGPWLRGALAEIDAVIASQGARRPGLRAPSTTMTCSQSIVGKRRCSYRPT
jgi:DNA-binding transcriptional MerR regulator